MPWCCCRPRSNDGRPTSWKRHAEYVLCAVCLDRFFTLLPLYKVSTSSSRYSRSTGKMSSRCISRQRWGSLPGSTECALLLYVPLLLEASREPRYHVNGGRGMVGRNAKYEAPHAWTNGFLGDWEPIGS